MAASVQKVYEELLLELVNKYCKKDNLILSGGCALICVANSLIKKNLETSLKFVYSDNNTLNVIFHDNDLLMGVVGEFNKNLKELEKITGASIYSRGNSILIKSDPENNPRLFANSLAISEDVTSVQKGVFTFCKFRENDKCPPWELRAKKIHHNSSKKTVIYDIAGGICESTDYFVKDIELPEIKAGDNIIFMNVGAYGSSMSSTYNSRPRPLEVLYNKDEYRVIRSRDTLEDLCKNEIM